MVITHMIVTHQVRRIVDVAVGPELGLDVLVTQQPHLLRQVFPVRTQQAPVEWDWWQQGHWLGPETATGGGGGGEKTS